VVVEADGGARGNPGPAGYGAVVRDADTGEVLVERSEAIGVATNNVAEYSGLIAGLKAAADLGAAEVEVRMDSKLVVEQMAGRWQIKNAGLRPLAAEAARLIRRFDSVAFGWIPRERNAAADRLANEAMDAAAGVAPADRGREPGGAVDGGSSRGGSASGGTFRSGSWEPPLAPPTRLVLVRHGETELTQQRRYSGRKDVPLSPHGVTQAEATAKRVAALAPSVTAVVSSPLSRCTGTARLIAGAVGGPPVVTDDDLIECDFGEWDGLTFAEVRERWATELDTWLGDPAVAPPGGESFREVTRRVHRAVERLRESYPQQTVVVVSHVSPIKLLLRDALAAGDAFLHRLYLDAAGVSIMDIWSDGAVAVRSINDTAHLPTPPVTR
jgi:probable phosphoglycerate mutase